MTRVLNIISDSNIGGAGHVLLYYLDSADRSRFETHIALPEGSLLVPELSRRGGVVHELPGLAERSYHREDVPVLMQTIRRVAPDIVHTHGAFSGRVAAKRCRVPVVYTRHSAFPVPERLKKPPGRWVNKLLNEHYADHIIAVSPAARENLTDGGISPRLITTMMNGVSPLQRPPEGELRDLRRALGIPEGGFVAGILARVEEYKGHATIVGAARLLRERGRELTVLVAGTGAFEAELRQLIDEQDLSDMVRLLGFRSDVAAVLSLMDVQLNASTGTDTSSLSILEGFSLGVPAIVSDYGGNPHLVEEGENGFIFPQRDENVLADRLERLMESPGLCGAMGKRAYELYSERFSGEIMAGNIEAVYDLMLSRRKHGKR